MLRSRISGLWSSSPIQSQKHDFDTTIQDQTFPWATKTANRLQFAVDLWMIAVYLLSCKGPWKLPDSVQSFLRNIQESVLLNYAFLHHSTIFTYLLEGGGCLSLPGEMDMMKRFILQFADLILSLAKRICDMFHEEIEKEHVGLIFVTFTGLLLGF